MKLIRQWLLTAAVALALLSTATQPASADKGGVANGGSGGGTSTMSEPGDGGTGP